MMAGGYPHRLRPYASRRQFLAQMGGGFGGMALAVLLSEHQRTEATAPVRSSPPGARAPHFPASAKAVIQIFCSGGQSQVDTWDYKPELARRAGKPFEPGAKEEFFAGKPGNLRPSYYPFHRHGQCGRWVSELFPRLAGCVDDMAFIYSMTSRTALHGPACFMMNTGFQLPGFPSIGSWVTYGLGCETENLPAYVVLPDPRGLPPGGPINWGAGFLPGVHQGTAVSTSSDAEPIADLFPPKTQTQVTKQGEHAARELLRFLNAGHLGRRPGNTDLEARIASYEMAARLQLSAPEALNLGAESRAIRDLYEIDHSEIGPFGRQCLLARRLVERGVRFVQVFCGAENTSSKKIRPNWDSHEDLPRDHGYWGPILDTGTSALLLDLKARGLLGQTLVICTTEFGRLPATQGTGKGRDHNPGTFTAWLAGGGIKGGTSYGQSDDLGFKALENPASCHDLQATALHLLGIDHERLTFYHNGIQRRLTDVHGRVLKEICA